MYLFWYLIANYMRPLQFNRFQNIAQIITTLLDQRLYQTWIDSLPDKINLANVFSVLVLIWVL